MKISRARRITQASAATAAGLMSVPLALLSAQGAAAATPALGTHSPASHSPAARPPAARQPAGPRLSIGVTDGRTSANVGDRLTYAVTVRNVGSSAVPHLTITLSLPPGVPAISASRHGASTAAKVTWHAAVPAGRAETFRATSQVRRPPARMARLAAVACASARGGSAPIVCAADLDRSTASAAATAAATAHRTAAPGGGSTAAYAVAGGVAVVAAGALVVVIGRRTRFRRGMRHSG